MQKLVFLPEKWGERERMYCVYLMIKDNCNLVEQSNIKKLFVTQKQYVKGDKRENIKRHFQQIENGFDKDFPQYSKNYQQN